ncbi:MAG TPA: nucleotidyl transferase AbiEii/AbiGii toxin family protein [Candidatus Paceibacterota bacterium]
MVEFAYPASLETGLDYIRPRVILELGTHTEPVPNENYNIQPYVAEYFPNLFSQPKCSIATVVARRTFWEKATILHAEYYRPLDNPMLLRYSRHYADVAQMGKTQIVDEALEDINLLKKVTNHKDMFYHCGWARYDLAVPGSFRLTPPQERLAAIRRDYRDMTAMFFSEPPTFDEIMELLSVLSR